jgi:hypothetical protein
VTLGIETVQGAPDNHTCVEDGDHPLDLLAWQASRAQRTYVLVQARDLYQRLKFKSIPAVLETFGLPATIEQDKAPADGDHNVDAAGGCAWPRSQPDRLGAGSSGSA